ncbi:DUF1232 domain-containing protein [Cryobacterium sp. 1639]|uniref:YkvA family protein n=1 Tax=Cryobacterium inferilacus TaxID=2866629 RepID=UPI001C73C7DD|nr:DUF1232 domain-containing protein [Cryobacterium sp. 1639]MBX0301391.1 DUF1232 domain-containing protein [Cryobacterium sp. 1639]
MDHPWSIIVGVAVGLVLGWLVLIVVMTISARRRSERLSLVAALRLAPDVLRLAGRLAADRTVTWWVRALVALLGLYLLSPIDLVPDFIPVIGYLDDAIIVVLVIRLAIRQAGSSTIARHWPGTPVGLSAVLTLTGAGSRQ